jgi:hypothetical protein
MHQIKIQALPAKTLFRVPSNDQLTSIDLTGTIGSVMLDVKYKRVRVDVQALKYGRRINAFAKKLRAFMKLCRWEFTTLDIDKIVKEFNKR